MVSKAVQRNERRTSLRDAQKQLTRQRLIAASHEAFTESGYLDTTIHDITDAADVNRATFYQHFADKAEIFLAAIEYQLETNTMKHWVTLDAALASGTRGSVRRWLAEAAHWWIENTAFVAAWNQAIAIEPTIQAAQSVLYDRIGKSLTSYQQSIPNDADKQRHVLLVEMLVLQLNGVLTSYLRPNPSPSELDVILDTLTDIWCGSLGIPSHPS